MSDTDVAAWSALLRVHAALVPVLDRELQGTCNLPLTWYDVLLELNSAPGRRLSMGQLGEVAVVSRTRVSRVVDQLAGEGLVVREANPDDRRSAYATITDAGRKQRRAGLRRLATDPGRDLDGGLVAAHVGAVLPQNAEFALHRVGVAEAVPDVRVLRHHAQRLLLAAAADQHRDLAGRRRVQLRPAGGDPGQRLGEHVEASARGAELVPVLLVVLLEPA